MRIPFERMCRVCMSESTTTLLPIWPSYLQSNDDIDTDESVSSVATMFTSFTVFGACSGDGLPENICLACISEMNQAYSFKQKCERSELALRAFQRKMMYTENVTPTSSRPVTNVPSEPNACDGGPTKEWSYSIQDQSVEDKPTYQCISCSMTFDSSEEIQTHLTEDLCAIECEEKPLPDDSDADDDINDLQDENVSLVADEEATVHLINDIGKATPNKPKFVCENCNASFAMQHSLNMHRDSKKCVEQTFECDICKRVYSTKRNIRRHIYRMHRVEKKRKLPKNANQEKKYKCTQCPKAFITQSGIRDHLRTHSGERPFLCSICGKGFGQNANLRQHMMRHSQMKPYQCRECPKTFVSKGELNSHQRIHDGAHPFVCDVCGSGFTTSSSMTKHRRIHTGERRYACDYCPLRFTALSTMKNHRRIHTGERPYQCQYCSRSFCQRSDCVSHTRIHTGERPYKCEICPDQFYKSCSLRMHMKKEHDRTLEAATKRYQSKDSDS